MQKLLQYIKSHKSLRISAMLPKYLSQDIQEILRKYKFTFEELCYRLKHNISLDKESEEINFKGEKKSSYIDAIKIWTVRDPLKLEIAKKNNLNYKVFLYKNTIFTVA